MRPSRAARDVDLAGIAHGLGRLADNLEEHVAKLQKIAVTKHLFGYDAMPVDVRAIHALQIVDEKVRPAAPQLGMQLGDTRAR